MSLCGYFKPFLQNKFSAIGQKKKKTSVSPSSVKHSTIIQNYSTKQKGADMK